MNKDMENFEKSYKVLGMTCASCASSLESLFKSQKGVWSVSVNYPNKSLNIRFDKGLISLRELQAKAKQIGYELIDPKGQETTETIRELEDKRLKKLKSKLIFSSIFAIPIFIMSMFFMGKIPYENWIMLILAIPVMFWGGAEFFIIAWKKLKHFSSNMDTLVALSTGVDRKSVV